MDEERNYSDPNEAELEENQISHSDKAAGILTDPSNTFTEMAKREPKTTDWLIPLVVFLVLVLISQILQNSNPAISYDAKQKRIDAVEKRFDEAVKQGQMTQEQADQQIEAMENMDFFVLQIIGVVFVTLIFFFLISAIYFLFGKFVFKGSGSYSSALVANGLPLYIGAIEVLIYTIAALVLQRGMANASIGSFMDMLPSTMTGLLLWILNPIAIWMYIVIGIGLARMFKSSNTVPFVLMTMIIFILSNLMAYAFMS